MIQKNNPVIPIIDSSKFSKNQRPKTALKGRQADEISLKEVRLLIPESQYRRDLLIENLHVINDFYKGLRDTHLVALAKLMNIAMAEVYEVASFYHHFEILRDDASAPTTTIRVCNSVSCELAGSHALHQELTKFFTDPMVRIVNVPCIGRCEQAPAAYINQYPVAQASVSLIKQNFIEHCSSHPHANSTANFNPCDFLEKSIPSNPQIIAPEYCGYQTYTEKAGYELLKKIVAQLITPEHAIKVMADSGLRGLGGAGFLAGKKWQIVKDFSGPKNLAVNIDEGEPGTFKDRTYLERDPHRFLEGMFIAAHVVDIDTCYIYLRDEYHGCRAILEKEIALLTANPPCQLPRIELRRGAGAYICGEESAMIESIEGKRGEPRLRPPYIAQVGLFGLPTLEHNFETLYWVRDILERGPEWFSSFGRNGRKGLRSFSVSGRVCNPGVKLAPAGITVQELIDEYCGGMLPGHRLYAYLPGGASGGILPATMNQIPLDFDTLQKYGCFIGSAAVIILGHQDRARDSALNVMRFFEHESCGQCTPCRVGTAKAAQLMSHTEWDHNTLNDLSQVMADASICGLGQAAPNPIRCVQQFFPHEVS